MNLSVMKKTRNYVLVWQEITGNICCLNNLRFDPRLFTEAAMYDIPVVIQLASQTNMSYFGYPIGILQGHYKDIQ